MNPGYGVDQLSRYSHPVGYLPDATLKDITHTELTCHLAHVDRLALERKGRVPRDDEKPSLPGEACNDVLGQPVRKILLFRIATHVLKRQDRDRRLIRKCKSRDQ